MKKQPIVSLCIPTNGVVEWVFPVLDSIFSQKVNNDDYEVVIADNGKNSIFKEKLKQYREVYENIVYAETDALPFLNEIEAYKRASGVLIKFINHRTLLLPGTLQKLIDFVCQNEEEKPIVYFSNGALKVDQKQYIYSDFDLFVRNLSYWSSWSTGMTIWNEDFAKLPKDISEFNELFPHMNILFNERKRSKYIIDNSLILKELETGTIPKAKYNLFGAFAIEYVSIILDLYRDGDISLETLLSVKNDNLDFLVNLYIEFVLRKKVCSYDLSQFKNSIEVFYNRRVVNKRLLWILLSMIKEKILK